MIITIIIRVWLSINSKQYVLYPRKKQDSNPTMQPPDAQIDLAKAARNTVNVNWPRVVQDQSVICSLFHLAKRPAKEEENAPVLPLDCLSKGDELPWVKLTGKMAVVDVDEDAVCWFRGLKLLM